MCFKCVHVSLTCDVHTSLSATQARLLIQQNVIIVGKRTANLVKQDIQPKAKPRLFVLFFLPTTHYRGEIYKWSGNKGRGEAFPSWVPAGCIDSEMMFVKVAERHNSICVGRRGASWCGFAAVSSSAQHLFGADNIISPDSCPFIFPFSFPVTSDVFKVDRAARGPVDSSNP